MTRREGVEALLQEVLPKIEGLKEESLAEIVQVRCAANADLHRYQEAAEELADTEAEITSLTAEREDLPDRAYRAGLDEAWEEEDRLKERYKHLKPAIESLEERRESLLVEMASLLPRDRDHGHLHDVGIYHQARVAGTAHEERAALEDLRTRLTKALDGAIMPVAQAHNDTRALVESWGEERKWDAGFHERVYGKKAG